MNLTTKLFCIFFITIFSTSAFAKKWRVNNGLTAPTQVDFNELKEAVENFDVKSGDTIYVEGSAQPYQGEIEIFKKLIILGPGYFLDEANDPPTLCNQLHAIIGGKPGITLKEGSDGSYITGLYFDTNFSSPISISIEETSDITITRNRMEELSFPTGPSPNIFTSTNIKITRNLICEDILLGCYHTINILIVKNNLIGNDIRSLCSNTSTLNILNGTVINNTFKANSELWIKGCEIAYNYVGCIDDEPDNMSIHDNILDDSNCQGLGSSNVFNPYNDDTFSCESDDWTLLPPDQTATHGAFNGMGTDPYPSPPHPNLSSWPFISECPIVQSCGDTTIQVQFKVRVNN